MSDFEDYNITPPENGLNVCPSTGYQQIGVCVPVTVMPFAHVKETKMKCCGRPVVKAADTTCKGRKNGICTFTISQTMSVEVPVDFGASVAVGDAYVDCLGVNANGSCGAAFENETVPEELCEEELY